MVSSCRHFFVALLTAALALSAPARGEDRDNLAAALSYVGFDLIGQPNPLSGGVDFLATNTFDGTQFDFGIADLSLSGPLSLQVSTGGRLLTQLEVSFSTAVNANANATPLSYVFNSDIGPQSLQINGTVFADGDFTLNSLGFYDLSLTYSSRRNITHEGSSGEDSTEDFDLGPIDVSGNLIADILTVLTEPFFNATGQDNPFEPYSGLAELSEILQVSTAESQTALAEGRSSADAVMARLLNPLENGSSRAIVSRVMTGATVPEPAVLVLMLLGIPAIVLRRSARYSAR